MKNRIPTCIVALLLSLYALGLAAQEVDAKITRLTDPAQTTGVRIGDVLHRHVELEAKQPYQLSSSALPAKGTNFNGVELADIKVVKKQHGEQTLYSIDFAYQVFRTADTPVVLELPAQKLLISGGPLALSVEMPAWRFWLSPLVVGKIDSAVNNLQPQLPPSLIDITLHQFLLVLFSALLAIGVIGIVYINADKRWLPFMGGAFARVHRQLKRLPARDGNEAANGKYALASLHQAFNHVYGANLFAHDVDDFLAAHPRFQRIRHEILAFFELSNAALFADKVQGSPALYQRLSVFSRQLRDCERGV